MANDTVGAETITALGAEQRTFESYENRKVRLGNLPVARAIPIRDRRTVGPWCFLDRFGPLSFHADRPMDVAPHPHIGLQTVTWLLAGEVLHDDSLASEAIARPGDVNVMTAGGGIAHAEQTPERNSHVLDGVQLWVALPDAVRGMAPAFQHVERVPLVESPSGIVRVFAGALSGATSPAEHFSPLLGVDVEVHPGSEVHVPLDPTHEHGLLVLAGDASFEGQELHAGQFYYLGTQRTTGALASRAGGRVLLIGGPPLTERILMWWNFVARTPGEIAAARADWVAHRRFGEVVAYQGPRLDAPELARLARPNPMS